MISSAAIPRGPVGGLTNGQRLFVGSAIAYAGLFVLMWGPTWFGFGGWLFLYPVFLLVWVPVEIFIVVSVVLLVREACRVQQGQRATRRSTGMLVVAILLMVLSLPVLWFGTSLLIPVL